MLPSTIRPRSSRLLPSLLSVLFIVLLSPSITRCQFSYTPTVFQPGEVLTYRVKWSLFRLGSVTVRQELADSVFPEYVQVTLDGESASGLPFIDVYFRSTSLVHVSNPTSILYELFSDRVAHSRMTYVYDPSNQRTFGIDLEEGEITRYDTLDAPVPYYDGSGLFMFARAGSGSDTTVTLPTVMDYRMGVTNIQFTRTVEMLDIAAFEEPVAGTLFTGFADWKGSSFAGMSGEFRGWVSTDDRRLVLRAEVKIFLGSAVIELESIGGQETRQTANEPAKKTAGRRE